MAQLVGGKVWRIQGTTITLPVRFADAEMAAAVFLADSRRAAGILRDTGLRPLSLAGRALSALMLVHYGEWALGSYDEAGIGLLVLGPGGRPGLHIVDLPVTGALTREAGQDLWALPKWLMTSDLVFTGDSAAITVHDGPAPVMRAQVETGGLPLPFGLRVKAPLWSRLDRGAQAGVLLRGAMSMSMHEVRAGRGRAQVQLGEHPMAARMAALGMTGRPLLTLHTRHLAGELDAFQPARAGAG